MALPRHGDNNALSWPATALRLRGSITLLLKRDLKLRSDADTLALLYDACAIEAEAPKALRPTAGVRRIFCRILGTSGIRVGHENCPSVSGARTYINLGKPLLRTMADRRDQVASSQHIHNNSQTSRGAVAHTESARAGTHTLYHDTQHILLHSMSLDIHACPQRPHGTKQLIRSISERVDNNQSRTNTS